jgi:hypothetical protein
MRSSYACARRASTRRMDHRDPSSLCPSAEKRASWAQDARARNRLRRDRRGGGGAGNRRPGRGRGVRLGMGQRARNRGHVLGADRRPGGVPDQEAPDPLLRGSCGLRHVRDHGAARHARRGEGRFRHAGAHQRCVGGRRDARRAGGKEAGRRGHRRLERPQRRSAGVARRRPRRRLHAGRLRGDRRYDVILDNVLNHAPRATVRVLAPAGTFMPNSVGIRAGSSRGCRGWRVRR